MPPRGAHPPTWTRPGRPLGAPRRARHSLLSHLRSSLFLSRSLSPKQQQQPRHRLPLPPTLGAPLLRSSDLLLRIHGHQRPRLASPHPLRTLNRRGKRRSNPGRSPEHAPTLVSSLLTRSGSLRPPFALFSHTMQPPSIPAPSPSLKRTAARRSRLVGGQPCRRSSMRGRPALRGLRAAIEGTPRCARARRMRWWRCRRRRPHRQRVPITGASPPSLCH